VKDTGFKLWYTGNTSSKNGVGIVLDKSLKDGVVDIKHQGDRIILVKLLVGDLVFNVISAYASQIGLNESVKMQFCKELDALVSSVPISEKLFIGEDLNGHVCSTRVGFDGVHGSFGYGCRN
jgi:exonuclease III